VFSLVGLEAKIPTLTYFTVFWVVLLVNDHTSRTSCSSRCLPLLRGTTRPKCLLSTPGIFGKQGWTTWCCPVDVFILAKTASIIIVEEQHAKLSCFSGCGNSALVRLPHVAQAKKLKMESVGQMEHGWLYTGEQNSHIRQVTYKSSCRNGISYGMC